jgi:hypothetical protein
MSSILRSALAAGIAAADEDVARQQLQRADFVLRPWLRRRFERVIADATVAAIESGQQCSPPIHHGWAADGTAAASVHCMQVAGLQLAKKSFGIALHDHDAVATAYRTLPAAVATTVPWVSALCAAAMITLMVAIGLWVSTKSSNGIARHSYTRPLSAPAAGAFVSGGVPLVDEKLAEMLRERLPQLVVATDRIANQAHDVDDTGEVVRAARLQELRAEPWFSSHGAAASAAWQKLLDAMELWATAARGPDGSKRQAIDEIISSARALSEQFAALGLGYYVEGDGFGNGDVMHGVLYMFRIEEVVFVDAGGSSGRAQRVLSLRRIDKLNMQRSMLGMESATLGDPMVLLDQIDAHVISSLLPVLAADADYQLGDDAWRQSSDATAAMIGSVAGQVIRKEFVAALGSDAKVTQQIASLIVERRKILDEIADMLRPRGISMNFPDEVFVGDGYLDSLDGSISRQQGDRLTEIESELGKLDAARIASRLQQIVVATVRRHEAQHGLDSAEVLLYPKLAEQHVGPEEIGDHENSLGSSVNAELSAYLSQLANDPQTPLWSMWSMARHAFSTVNWGRAESYVAVFVIAGMAKHCGIDDNAIVIHDGEIDRRLLGKLALELSARPPATIRKAASDFWTELYGRPALPILDRR